MESPDTDMLDVFLPDSQTMVGGVEHHDWDVTEEEFPNLVLSSSPMSLGEEPLDAYRHTDHNVDEDSTSRLYASNDCIISHSDLTLTLEDVVPSSVAVVPDSVVNLSSAQAQVVVQIESIFESLADALLTERSELSIELGAYRLHNANEHISHRQAAGRSRNTTVTFPGKSSEEAWRFTVIVRLLELMHEAITSNIVVTKRDMYYRDPALFGKQSVVDRYVDQIALAFGATRSCMNVTAAAKGLMAGALTFSRRDGSRLDVVNNNEGTLIPSLEEILSVEMRAVQWILVVEKEATFQSIIASAEWQQLRWRGVVVTGKGYPDIATRAMTRFITRATPQNGFVSPKVYGLMDYDPDGLAILSTYKHGSLKLDNQSKDLAVPEMCWLGLNSTHISDSNQTHHNQGLMPLTKRDRHKARKMLEQDRMTEDGSETGWRGQLQIMLALNLKAELQLLDATPGVLMDLIQSATQ